MEDMETSEEEMAVSISAVGAVAYICCTVTFILLVCLLFFLGLTPTQRSVNYTIAQYSELLIAQRSSGFRRQLVSESQLQKESLFHIC